MHVMTVLQTAGLSHSEISGSQVICTYPELIAAYHVLHRLREPRHPPCALLLFLLPLPDWHASQHTAGGSYFQLCRPPLSSHTGTGDGFLCVFLFYSLACVNMSKISDLWRISGSNR